MLVAAVLLALAPQGATQDLGAELARVVDLPTPAARAIQVSMSAMNV